MNSKLIVALVGVGFVAFCMMFFRTGAPDLKGLTRPKTSLSTYSGTAAKSGGPANSRFSSTGNNEEDKINKTKNRNNLRKTAREKRKARARNNIRNKANTKPKVGGFKANGRGLTDDTRSNQDRELDRDRRVRGEITDDHDGDGVEIIDEGYDPMDEGEAPGVVGSEEYVDEGADIQ